MDAVKKKTFLYILNNQNFIRIYYECINFFEAENWKIYIYILFLNEED